MEITDIKVRKLIKNGKMKAVVSITLYGQLAVHDIKVIEGENRLFVAMPSRKTNAGNHKDIVHPISSEIRKILEDAIINEYNRVIESGEMEYSDLTPYNLENIEPQA